MGFNSGFKGLMTVRTQMINKRQGITLQIKKYIFLIASIVRLTGTW